MRRRTALLALVALAPLAQAQDLTPDPDEPAQPNAPVYADALSERLLTCLLQEGSSPTPDERAVVSDVAAALGPSIARRVGGEACDETPASQVECASRVRSLTCEALSAHLTPGDAQSAPPPWAVGHARSVAQRVGVCAAEERDGAALDDDDRRALAEFESSLASALGAMTATGGCVVDENALPACAASVGAVACEGLGARLGEDPSGLARTVTPACAAMIRCGTNAVDDGGADDDDGAVDDAATVDDDAP